MTDKDLLQNLKSLKNITPRADYTSWSRMTILSFPKRLEPRWEMVGKGVLAESFNFGLSMVLTAAALILVLGGATSILRVMFLNNLPGVDTKGLITEADAVTKDIDIQLSEAEYYAVTAKEASIALKEVSVNGPAHINPLLIEREAQGFDFNDPTNQDIDDLLNQITQ